MFFAGKDNSVGIYCRSWFDLLHVGRGLAGDPVKVDYRLADMTVVSSWNQSSSYGQAAGRTCSCVD